MDQFTGDMAGKFGRSAVIRQQVIKTVLFTRDMHSPWSFCVVRLSETSSAVLRVPILYAWYLGASPIRRLVGGTLSVRRMAGIMVFGTIMAVEGRCEVRVAKGFRLRTGVRRHRPI